MDRCGSTGLVRSPDGGPRSNYLVVLMCQQHNFRCTCIAEVKEVGNLSNRIRYEDSFRML